MQTKTTTLSEAAFVQGAPTQPVRGRDSADKGFSQCLADKQRQSEASVQPRTKADKKDAGKRTERQTDSLSDDKEATSAPERVDQPMAGASDAVQARPPEAVLPEAGGQSNVFLPPVALTLSLALTNEALATDSTVGATVPARADSGQFMPDWQVIAAGGQLNSTVNAAALLAEVAEQLPVVQSLDQAGRSALPTPTVTVLAADAQGLAGPEQAAGEAKAVLTAGPVELAGTGEQAVRSASPEQTQARPTAEAQAGRESRPVLAATLATPLTAKRDANQANGAVPEVVSAPPTVERIAGATAGQTDAQLQQFDEAGPQEPLPQPAKPTEGQAGVFNLAAAQAPVEVVNYGVVASPQEKAGIDAREVLRQVADQVRFVRRPGVEEMTMRLNPEALGEVTVKLMLEGGRLTARFHADNPEVRQVLENSLQQLKLELSTAGLKVHDVGVYAGLDNPLSQHQGERGQAWAGMTGGDKRKAEAHDAAAQLELQTANSSTDDELAVDYRI